MLDAFNRYAMPLVSTVFAAAFVFMFWLDHTRTDLSGKPLGKTPSSIPCACGERAWFEPEIDGWECHRCGRKIVRH